MTRRSFARTWAYLQEPPMPVALAIVGLFLTVLILGTAAAWELAR